ncbi:MAG: ferritin-like protein [Chloroflexi bacterium]|nr:ferritin-like protein [Chloroflexota bacterium]
MGDLVAHLYQAAQLEMSTIPLYLYAGYSIQTRSYSQWSPGVSAFRAIRSVVIEEMLHLSLVRNLMVAIGAGDQMRFYDERFLPTYPTRMLHRIPALELPLEPCSRELMAQVFVPLELPEKADAPPEPHRYGTIGQFYAAIRLGFQALDTPSLWANNRPDLQYTSAYWNQDGGGEPITVCDIQSAMQALDTIVEQGEGARPHDTSVPIEPADPVLGEDELSHYAKFRRIADGIDGIGTVYPVPRNPRTADFEPPVRGLSDLFNAGYCFVLSMLDAIYTTSRSTVQPGATSTRYGLERNFIAAMGGLLFPVADLLVRTPLSGGQQHAAPTFQFHQFAEDQSKKAQLIRLCDDVASNYPELGGDNGVRWLISGLPAL